MFMIIISELIIHMLNMKLDQYHWSREQQNMSGGGKPVLCIIDINKQ